MKAAIACGTQPDEKQRKSWAQQPPRVTSVVRNLLNCYRLLAMSVFYGNTEIHKNSIIIIKI
jgi:hypothetical protein